MFNRLKKTYQKELQKSRELRSAVKFDYEKFEKFEISYLKGQDILHIFFFVTSLQDALVELNVIPECNSVFFFKPETLNNIKKQPFFMQWAWSYLIFQSKRNTSKMTWVGGTSNKE